MPMQYRIKIEKRFMKSYKKVYVKYARMFEFTKKKAKQ